MIRFNAHCARGHDRVDFTDPAAFEAHMAGEHRAKRIAPGSMGPHLFANRPAPMMRAGKVVEPYAWEAPKATRGGLDKLARDLEAGKYDLPHVYAGGTYRENVRMGEVA